MGVRRPSPRNWHRGAVGGMWEEIGQLQFEFLVGEGLTPEHYLLDMGCGSLRGGVHFVRYLEPGHYFGIDRNAKLLAAGESELERAGVSGKHPTLVARSDFDATSLGQSFDFALAQSLFTHLPFNTIVRCVAEVGRVLSPGGRFFATFFANPGPRLRTEPMPIRSDISIPVRLDQDPYYYDPALFSWLCEGSDLVCEHYGEWGHPRSQQMLVFTKQKPRSD
ncbi:MAG: class I SAM-dependent methyltransferase [Solirubrobacterales bacterium]